MTSSSILIACPNLSLDRTMRIEALTIGGIHRTTETDARGGGKGVNVARALKSVGLSARVVGLAGGRTGEAVTALLGDEGFDHHSVSVQGETRSCLTVLAGGAVTVFNEDGPPITEDEWRRFEDAVIERAQGTDIVAISGSFPPGCPPDGAARLVGGAHDAGCFVVCDTSGPIFERALVAAPDVVKPNLSEALAVLEGHTSETTETREDGLDRAAGAAAALLQRGPAAVVVTAGAAGAVLAEGNERPAFSSPSVEVLNPVGAGDCLVAGIIAGKIRGEPLVEAVRRGVAMAAASCETFPAGLLDPKRAETLLRAARQ